MKVSLVYWTRNDFQTSHFLTGFFISRYEPAMQLSYIKCLHDMNGKKMFISGTIFNYSLHGVT